MQKNRNHFQMSAVVVPPIPLSLPLHALSPFCLTIKVNGGNMIEYGTEPSINFLQLRGWYYAWMLKHSFQHTGPHWRICRHSGCIIRWQNPFMNTGWIINQIIITTVNNFFIWDLGIFDIYKHCEWMGKPSDSLTWVASRWRSSLSI